VLVKTDPLGTVEWDTLLGINVDDYGQVVLQTFDGGYIVAADGGGRNFFYKLDDDGNIIWQRNYPAFYSTLERLDMKLTRDGGYIVAGTNTYSQHIYIQKLDSLGNQQWYHSYGDSTGPLFYKGKRIIQTNDNGYVVVGSKYILIQGNQMLLLKTDANGIQQWERTYGGINSDEGWDVQQTIDGGYAVLGWSSNTPNSGIYFVKTDTVGNMQWSNIYSGLYYCPSIHCLLKNIDGGYTIAGTYNVFATSVFGVSLLRIDTNGIVEYVNYYDNLPNRVVRCVRPVQDGGLFVVGLFNNISNSTSNIFYSRMSLEMPIDFDFSLTPIGNINLPNTGGVITFNVGIDNNNTYNSFFEIWSMLIYPNGNCVFSRGPVSTTLDTAGIISAERQIVIPRNYPSGQYIYKGYMGLYPYIAYYQSSFIFTKAVTFEGICCNEKSSDSEFITHHSSFIISANPNPFNSSVALRFELPDASQIELKIFDISGREVASLVNGQWSTGEHEVSWNAEGMPSGIYFAKLMVDGRWSMVEKLLLLR
jgi:hypothetical protein